MKLAHRVAVKLLIINTGEYHSRLDSLAGNLVFGAAAVASLHLNAGFKAQC
jgi:hypothetical protein